MNFNYRFLIVLIITAFILPLSVSAQYQVTVPSGSSYGLPESDLVDVLEGIIKWVVGFVVLIAILMIVWAGMSYMVSAGDQSKVETAKKIFTYAIIGLLIAALAYAIVKFIIEDVVTEKIEEPTEIQTEETEELEENEETENQGTETNLQPIR
jgi:predicted permease